MHELDDLDRKILNALQTDASVPLKTLADELCSSVATCQRRINRMIEQNVIIKQVALVNPIAVGRALSVFVSVSILSQNLEKQEQFINAMNQEPDVISCYEISGEFDYILLVHAIDMLDYHQFTRRALTEQNNVRGYKSEFVMNSNKVETKINL